MVLCEVCPCAIEWRGQFLEVVLFVSTDRLSQVGPIRLFCPVASLRALDMLTGSDMNTLGSAPGIFTPHLLLQSCRNPVPYICAPFCNSEALSPNVAVSWSEERRWFLSWTFSFSPLPPATANNAFLRKRIQIHLYIFIVILHL